MNIPDLSRARWRKSSFSGQNGVSCVELACLDTATAVRDSKNPTGPVLSFGQAELASFFGAIKAGRLDG
jgi:hypothetical protein